MALKDVLITITAGQGGTDVYFVIKGNPTVYSNLAAVTNSGFEAAEAADADFAKVANVITPITALLEGGAFKRIKANEAAPGKRSRTAVVPSKAVEVITAAVESTNGLAIDGVTCKSVSQGLRRKAR